MPEFAWKDGGKLQDTSSLIRESNPGCPACGVEMTTTFNYLGEKDNTIKKE
jgi:hypothetical protein